MESLPYSDNRKRKFPWILLGFSLVVIFLFVFTITLGVKSRNESPGLPEGPVIIEPESYGCGVYHLPTREGTEVIGNSLARFRQKHKIIGIADSRFGGIWIIVEAPDCKY